MSGPRNDDGGQETRRLLSPRFATTKPGLRRMAVYNPVFMRVRRRVRALLAVMTLTARRWQPGREVQTSAAPGGRVVHPLFELRSPTPVPSRPIGSLWQTIRI